MQAPIRLSWAGILLFGMLTHAAIEAHADDATGEGSAMIVNGDTFSAKSKATKAALADAAYKQGFFLQAEQIAERHQLTADKIQIKTYAKISRYEVIETVALNDAVHVRIRAHIDTNQFKPRQKSLGLGTTLEEIPFGIGQYRLVLTKVLLPSLSPRAYGESLVQLRDYAEQLRQEGGFSAYTIVNYSESISPGLFFKNMTAQAKVHMKTDSTPELSTLKVSSAHATEF